MLLELLYYRILSISITNPTDIITVRERKILEKPRVDFCIRRIRSLWLQNEFFFAKVEN